MDRSELRMPWRGVCSSDIPDEEQENGQVPRIGSGYELDEVVKQSGGVYHVDSEVFEAWQKGRSSGEDDLGVVGEGEGFHNIEELQDSSVSDDSEAEYGYAKMRLENDPVEQGDLDLEKVEEARAAILQKVLGNGSQYEVLDNLESEKEDEYDEFMIKKSQEEPTDEQIERRKELMREIAEGMKALNLRKGTEK